MTADQQTACTDQAAHPAHIVFPIGDFPTSSLHCPGVEGERVEQKPRKRINGDAKGKKAERDVVAYLKPVFPDARRTVRTGYRNAVTSADDEGDIDGTPGLCFQVKALGAELVSGKVLTDLHADVRVQAAGRLPLILNKRPSKSDVGQWWVWLTVGDLVHLKAGVPPYMVNGGKTLIRVPLFNIIFDLKSYSDKTKGTTTT